MTTLFKNTGLDMGRPVAGIRDKFPDSAPSKEAPVVVQAALVKHVEAESFQLPAQPVEESQIYNHAAAVKRKIIESEKPAESGSSSTPIQDDKEWKRLQAILKRHSAADEKIHDQGGDKSRNVTANQQNIQAEQNTPIPVKQRPLEKRDEPRSPESKAGSQINAQQPLYSQQTQPISPAEMTSKAAGERPITDPEQISKETGPGEDVQSLG